MKKDSRCLIKIRIWKYNFREKCKRSLIFSNNRAIEWLY